MTSPPRRLRPDAQQRQHNIDRSARVLSGRGTVQAARPVTAPTRTQILGGSIKVVVHGDDPNVARPVASIVLWHGAADPVNKQPYDFRYPVTA